MTRLQPSPAVLLQPHHVPKLRAIVAQNPGASLRKLCPLVRDACALPSMNIATLHRFMKRHRIDRQMPKGAVDRVTARRTAQAWSWTSPDEVCSHALAAFYGSCRSMEAKAAAAGHPPSLPWPEAAREAWLLTFLDAFQLRLYSDAQERGIGDFVEIIDAFRSISADKMAA
jgi:hypothetical protein